jgi:formylglycine-generating enzyme required for sulfatase activity
MEIAYSPPEARQRMHDLAEAMIQLNSGLMTEELLRILDKKADEFGVHRLDMEDILKELAPVQSTIINEKDGSQLVLIHEGEFLVGGSAKDEGGGQPFPVRLPAYYLALYPVANIQYAQFLSQGRPSESDLNKWINLDSYCFVRKAGSRYEAYGNKNYHPVVNVSWYGANAYAKWAGLRLPSELELEKGARGVDGREYPWGNTWDKSKCRNWENRGNERTCGVQSYSEGNSPWGLYQMSGNVWEWCEDWYDSEAYNRYRQGNLSPPSKVGGRVLRGGSWNFADPRCFRGAYRVSSAPEVRSNDCGFRLARTVTL